MGESGAKILALAGKGGVGKTYSGSTLMHAGYTLPQLAGDYPSVQMYVKRV